jgi:hypothetical protein
MNASPSPNDEEFEARLANWEANWRVKKLRLDRPWAYDITRALVSRPNGLSMQRIYEIVRDMRGDSDLPQPTEFEAVVRSTIYEHAKESSKWNGKREDGLFYSPRRGHWCTHRQVAVAWIERHEAEIFERHQPVPDLE